MLWQHDCDDDDVDDDDLMYWMRLDDLRDYEDSAKKNVSWIYQNKVLPELSRYFEEEEEGGGGGTKPPLSTARRERVLSDEYLEARRATEEKWSCNQRWRDAWAFLCFERGWRKRLRGKKKLVLLRCRYTENRQHIPIIRYTDKKDVAIFKKDVDDDDDDEVVDAKRKRYYLYHPLYNVTYTHWTRLRMEKIPISYRSAAGLLRALLRHRLWGLEYELNLQKAESTGNWGWMAELERGARAVDGGGLSLSRIVNEAVAEHHRHIDVDRERDRDRRGYRDLSAEAMAAKEKKFEWKGFDFRYYDSELAKLRLRQRLKHRDQRDADASSSDTSDATGEEEGEEAAMMMRGRKKPKEVKKKKKKKTTTKEEEDETPRAQRIRERGIWKRLISKEDRRELRVKVATARRNREMIALLGVPLCLDLSLLPFVDASQYDLNCLTGNFAGHIRHLFGGDALID